MKWANFSEQIWRMILPFKLGCIAALSEVVLTASGSTGSWPVQCSSETVGLIGWLWDDCSDDRVLAEP